MDQREKEKSVCGCASTLVSGCIGQHDTTQHHNNDPAQRVSLFSPQIQTQTIWHWPSFNRTTSMLTGRLSYNPIGHAGHRMSLIGWGAHVSVETGGMDQEVDRLHRLRTAPRFVWGLRPCTTLLASNKSWIYFPPTHTHTPLTLITAESEVWKLAASLTLSSTFDRTSFIRVYDIITKHQIKKFFSEVLL